MNLLNSVVFMALKSLTYKFSVSKLLFQKAFSSSGNFLYILAKLFNLV